jgi:hypothetical protein
MAIKTWQQQSFLFGNIFLSVFIFNALIEVNYDDHDFRLPSR